MDGTNIFMSEIEKVAVDWAGLARKGESNARLVKSLVRKVLFGRPLKRKLVTDEIYTIDGSEAPIINKSVKYTGRKWWEKGILGGRKAEPSALKRLRVHLSK